MDARKRRIPIGVRQALSVAVVEWEPSPYSQYRVFAVLFVRLFCASSRFRALSVSMNMYPGVGENYFSLWEGRVIGERKGLWESSWRSDAGSSLWKR